MSTCSLRTGHAALWEIEMSSKPQVLNTSEYKITVTKGGRRYFSTSEGDLPNFTQAEQMYRDFKALYAQKPEYRVFLYNKQHVYTFSWEPVNL